MPSIKQVLMTGTCRKCGAKVEAKFQDTGVCVRILFAQPFPCSCGSEENELGQMIDAYDWNWPSAKQLARL